MILLDEIRLNFKKMAKFRDVTKEATDIIEAISLEREHSLLEIGTGRI